MPRIFNQTVRTTNTPHDLRPIRAYTASRTLREGDGTVVVDTTAGNVTLTLPVAATSEGRLYTIVKKVAANTVTITRSGTDTIGYAGATSTSLSARDEQISLLSGGSEDVWYACACGTPAAGAVDSAWHTRSATATGTVTVTTTTQYLMLGTCSTNAAGQTAIGDAQHRIPRAVTLKSIYVQLAAALTGTQVLTCRINKNGTPDSGITVTHNSGTGTLASATGTVAVAMDDLVCYEFGFSGGLTTASPQSVTAAYALVPE